MNARAMCLIVIDRTAAGRLPGLTLVLAALASCLLAGPAAAQSAPDPAQLIGPAPNAQHDTRSSASSLERRAYAQGTLSIDVAPAGTANHRVSPPLGGNSMGIAASAGGFVTPTMAIEGELVIAGTVSAQQRFSYLWREDYRTESRSLLLNGNVRWKLGAASLLEFVAGGGLAVTRTHNSFVVLTDARFPPAGIRTTPLPDRRESARFVSLTAGVDAPIRLGTRAAVVPTVRFRCIPRRQTGMAAYAGVGSLIYQFGVSLRAGF
jgi:hypothetical protein